VKPAPGAGMFHTTGGAYDSFMGRYSRPLAALFADSVGVLRGQSALDVGCGPGALTGLLVDRLGAEAVAAFDPSLPFVAECAAAHPGVDVRSGRAEAIPFDDDRFDIALAQLVLHFVSDPTVAGVELRRVVRPGGIVGACVWDFDAGMEMLRLFWDAAVDADPAAPDEARTMRFGRDGEIADWLGDAGLHEVVETTLAVTSTYTGFDEVWSGFLAGIGPAGSYCVSLSADQQAAVRQGMLDRLGAPDGALILTATARSAHGHVPG
jgi:SAM-dependent methyltransferase